MRGRLWVLFGLFLGVSFAVQVAWPDDLAERPETSYETAPRGHAALFELLERFGAVHGRWLSGVSLPPVEEPIWFIASRNVCDSQVAETSTREDRITPFRVGIEPWIEAGGTAVVWLAHPPLQVDGESWPEADATERLEVSFRSSVIEGSEGARKASGSASADTVRIKSRAVYEDVEDAESTRKAWRESLEASRRNLRDGEPSRCGAIAGHALPSRHWTGLEGDEIPEDAESAAMIFEIARSVGSTDGLGETLDYDTTRLLPGPTLAFFERENATLEGWRPVWVEADDLSPLVLERTIGRGRLVVVSDARVMTNARLGRADSAPFVFDFVNEWGSPWIDEHLHGVVPEPSAIRYLIRSPAWAAVLGLMALGGLLAWRGHAWPERDVEEVDPDAPTLTSFVESVARLYAESGDHARAFDRYRALSLERIRRALGLPPGTSTEFVLARLRARAENRTVLREKGLRDLLTEELRIENAGQLERAVVRLDELVRALREDDVRNIDGQAATPGVRE